MPEVKLDELPQEETKGAVLDWMIKTFDPWLESKRASNTLIIFFTLLVAIPIIGVGLATTRTILPLDQLHIPIQVISSTYSQFTNGGVHADFKCAAGKSIQTTFYKGDTKTPVTAGEPPIPGGSVRLSLSDGRTLTLPQTLSADGARYANPDESFIFWNRGNTAFIEEAGKTTYSACVTNG